MSTTVGEMLREAGVTYLTRTDWGSPRQADGSYARRRSTHPMPPGPARYHFLHITVTGDTDTITEARAGARQVESYGLSTPPMVSYQDLVTNEGTVLQGQDYGTKGTHTVNDKNIAGFPNDLNLLGYATAILQNVADEVTDVQVERIAMIYAARELLGLVRRGAPVYPHRMFAWKECPGDKAVARLEEIIRLKNRYVTQGYLPGTKEDDVLNADDKKWIEERIDKRVSASEEKVIAEVKKSRDRDSKQSQREMTLLRKIAKQGSTTEEDVAEARAIVDEGDPA